MLWSDSSAKMGLGFEEMEAAGTFQMCYSRYRRLSLSLWRETEGDYRSFDLLWRCPGSHKCNTVLYSPLTSENAFMAGDADPELPAAVNGFLPSWEKTLWMSSFFFSFSLSVTPLASVPPRANICQNLNRIQKVTRDRCFPFFYLNVSVNDLLLKLSELDFSNETEHDFHLKSMTAGRCSF